MQPPLWISEIHPNPKGKDRGNEWLELCSGDSSVSLGAYSLQIGKRSVGLYGFLASNRCVVVKTGTVSIRNREAIVYLRGPGVDQHITTAGSAPEDKSFVVPYLGNPVWSTSTPGILVDPPTPTFLEPQLYQNSYLGSFFGTGVATTGILLLLLILIYKCLYADIYTHTQ